MLLAPVSARADDAYTLVEAEASPQGTVVADASCSGGKYVHRDGDYQPVIFAPVPKDGDSFILWARVRGEALQLKGVAEGGKQTDLNWVYDKPDEFAWESFGRHTRAELGAQALLIKGPGANGNSGLDAVVFTSSDAFDPNKALPKPKDADFLKTDPATAKITVDWAATAARTTPWNFGSNDWAITEPDRTAKDPAFQARLADMDISMIRIHNGGLIDAWTDPRTRTWDDAKIEAAYNAPYLRGKTILQNIPGWPSWMKQADGMLDPSEYDDYARLCAGLVGVVNHRLHKNVRFWEPLNEQDNAYAAKGKLADLWTIYDKCAAAMRAEDPSVKIGGAAFTWDDPVKIQSFLEHSAANIDFLTWHRYASGSKDDSDDKIMTGTPGFGDSARNIRAMADRTSPNWRILLAMDEYSVDYTYSSQETRQNTIFGAVWFASVLKHMSEAGVDITASWNLKDGFYGLMDGANTLKPAAQVFAWSNRYLVGAVAKTSSDEPMVEAMAVRQSDGSRSLLLINKSGAAKTAVLSGLGAADDAQATRLDASGIASDGAAASNPERVALPPYSLLLVRFGSKTTVATEPRGN